MEKIRLDLGRGRVGGFRIEIRFGEKLRIFVYNFGGKKIGFFVMMLIVKYELKDVVFVRV